MHILAVFIDSPFFVLAYFCCIFIGPLTLKAPSRQMVTFRGVQCHPDLTYIFNF